MVQARDLRAVSLHNTLQASIAQGIRTAASVRKQEPAKWRYEIRRPCAACNRSDDWDATRQLSDVKTEHSVVPGTRADIVLDYEDGSSTVIEVVDTNDLGADKFQAYKEAGIRCVRVFPTDANLDSMLTSITVDPEGVNPDIFKCDNCSALDAVARTTTAVREATQPCCINCASSLRLLSVYVVQTDCWQCKDTMLQAFGQQCGRLVPPSEFPKVAVDVAVGAGAILRVQYSRTVGDAYRANTCGSCGALSGENYLFCEVLDHLYDIGGMDSTVHPVRTFSFCPECDGPPEPLHPTQKEIREAKETSDARYIAWRKQKAHEDAQREKELIIERERARQRAEEARANERADWQNLNDWIRDRSSQELSDERC